VFLREFDVACVFEMESVNPTNISNLLWKVIYFFYFAIQSTFMQIVYSGIAAIGRGNRRGKTQNYSWPSIQLLFYECIKQG